MMSRRRMIMAQSHGGGPAPSIPDNEVWYYAPAQVTLYSSRGVVSHTFADGKGVLTFANPVTKITNWLQACDTITDVKMPETVTSIGSLAFYDCKALALTSLPSGITSISNYAFSDCKALALTSLPSGVTSIDTSAFYRCSALALTSLPSGVTSIGYYVFYGCKAIQSLTINRVSPPTLGDYAFDESSFPIYVPASAVDTYKAASGWRTYASRIFAIPE